MIFLGMDSNEENALIGRMKEGDREAFNAFFVESYASLLAYANMIIGDKDVAEDIIQEVFLSVWEGRVYLSIDGSLRSYFLRSVYNSAMNYIKHERVVEKYSTSRQRELKEYELNYDNPDRNHIIQKLFNEELNHILNEAIDTLPDKCKEVFKLSYVYDMKRKDISEALNISLRTVDNHIYKALKLIRERLSAYPPSLLFFLLLRRLLKASK